MLVFWLILTTIFSILASIFSVIDIFDRRSATEGVLVIDHSNPEKDVYRFEIDDLERLSQKKKIIVRIDQINRRSQK